MGRLYMLRRHFEGVTNALILNYNVKDLHS